MDTSYVVAAAAVTTIHAPILAPYGTSLQSCVYLPTDEPVVDTLVSNDYFNATAIETTSL